MAAIKIKLIHMALRFASVLQINDTVLPRSTVVLLGAIVGESSRKKMWERDNFISTGYLSPLAR